MAEMSRENFVEQVIELVRKRLPLVKIGRSSEPFSLRLNGRVMGLENLYRSVMQKPDQMVHTVERWAVELLRAAEGSPDRTASFDELSDRIMPVLVTSEYFESNKGALVGQLVVDGIYVAYVIDGDRTITHIPSSQFKKWDIDIDQLHEKALANLVGKSQSLAAESAMGEDGRVILVLFAKGDGYDASRLLLPLLHEQLREHLGSPFLAAIPNRDILICVRNDASILGSVREQIARDYRTMPRQITERLFLVTPDGLAPYAEAAA